MELLSDLNDAQRQAVLHVEGPLLVLAGAGAGKTRVITRRVAHLVQQGVAPWNILAITFTNKAAGEMKARIEALGVPAGAAVGTFHAVATRLLREFSDAAGVGRNFTIYDADDQLRCVKEAMKRSERQVAKLMPSAIRAEISRAKNQLLLPPQYAQKAQSEFQRAVAGLYPLYEKVLQENSALDFDDLLIRAARLLANEPVRLALSERWRYILIDEYQDTNHAQYVIVHGIALAHENICATGDPDQSIYGWRGADIRNILDFEADYPNATVVRLEQNYRSVQPILSAASRLIAHNRRRKEKQLIAVRPGGEDVQVIRLPDERAEARKLAELVGRLHRQGMPYRHMAVFYRVNALSRVLEEAFRARGISYQIARGVEFYNRKEIKDVLAYLRLLVNPSDNVSCERIINFPPRGIGDATVERLWAAAERTALHLLELCRQAASAGLTKAAEAKVATFAQLIGELANMAGGPEMTVRQIVQTVVERTGIEQLLVGDEEQRQALKNVQELISAAADFDERNPGLGLADYLYQVALVSDVDSIDPQAGAVTFMTLHAAKGLEFPVVFMIGCEEGLLPFQRNGGEDSPPRDLEEERRLAFVGMTRTKDRLTMTHVRYRSLRGQRSAQAASPFLAEIGNEGVSRTDETTLDAPPRTPTIDELQRRRDLADPEIREERLRQEIYEAELAADLVPEEFAGLRVGQRVHSPVFGTGRVVSISPAGVNTRAVVDFDRAGRKTLVLQYAGLEPM